MLKYYNYDIVCQEIPDEVTLAVNISGCPNRCPGCHSPWLQEDIGEALTTDALSELMDKYGSAVTCLCFMGGDREPQEVERLAKFVRNAYPRIKIGWYSGCDRLPAAVDMTSFQFVKLGAYVESRGGLRSESTNQRLYKIEPDGRTEILRIG